MKKWGLILLLLATNAAFSLTVTLYETTKPQRSIGTITFKDSSKGLEIIPHLHSLSPGAHGFHIHQKPNCNNKGMDALGHFDPHKTDEHLGPYQHGHQGDLPKLMVNKEGMANKKSYAPNLAVKDLKGHSVMIHAGGDNYSDTPLPLGGGGARIACGVV